MKRFLTIILFLLVSLSLHAQMNLIQTNRYEVVGRNLLNNCDITAYKETFNTRIHRSTIDSVSNTALIILWEHPGAGIVRNSNYDSQVVYYDLTKQKPKWEKKVNLNDDEIGKIGDFICFEKKDQFYLLDSETGKTKYKLGKNLETLLFNYKDGWMICASYNNLLGKNGSLQKINMHNGALIWKKDAYLDYGLKVHGLLNDSTALFVGGGLRGVNMNSGSMWTCDLDTDESGYISYKTQFYVGIYSNVKKEDSTFLYFAAKDKIVKLKYDGTMMWKVDLDPEEMSKSYLEIQDNFLLLVNRGCTYGTTYVAKIGEPFFAVFDKNNGTKRYQIDCRKFADFIIGFYVYNGSIFLLFQNRYHQQMVGKFRIFDGKFLSSYTIDVSSSEAIGSMYGFIDSHVYAKQDSALVNLKSIDSTGLFLCGDKGVLYLNHKLLKTQFFKNEDLYTLEKEFDGLRLFNNNDTIVVVDSLNREVATINFNKIFVTESELYCIKDNTLYIINKSQIPFIKKKDEFNGDVLKE